LFALFALFALFSVGSAQTATQCTQFCMDYNVTCMGLSTQNDIYATMEACEAECMQFPVDMACQTGDINDAANCASGNSYGCRRYHLSVANDTSVLPGNPATHCPHTTPLSAPTADNTITVSPNNSVTDTVCGTQVNGSSGLLGKNGLVADFCNQVTDVCNSFLGGLNMGKCVATYSHIGGATDVANYPNGAIKFPIGSPNGATELPCRRYHAQVARGSTGTAVGEHCIHALFGDGACGTTCETYCTLGAAICPTMFDTNCMTDCANTVPAPINYAEITNHDLVCRIYHMTVAAQSAALNTDHCPHATIMSTPDTCGAASLSISALLIAALALITKFSS